MANKETCEVCGLHSSNFYYTGICTNKCQIQNEVSRPDWDTYFLSVARTVSIRSDCERDKVGAVVVKDRRIRASGYNGAPSGAPGCDSCPRRTSNCPPGSSYDNCVAIHAEANALLHCDRADLIGATLYVTRKPCYACSKLIAGAGITKVITPEDL